MIVWSHLSSEHNMITKIYLEINLNVELRPFQHGLPVYAKESMLANVTLVFTSPAIVIVARCLL